MKEEIESLKKDISASIKRDPFFVYGDSNAVKVEAQSRTLANLCKALYWLTRTEREENSK